MINYTVHNSTLNNIVIDLARDTVTGDTRDYLYFNTGAYDSVLVLADNLTVVDADTVTTDYATIISYHYGTASAPTGFTQGYVITINKSFDNVTLSNVEHTLCYSSLEDFPHLREGVENYAWAESFILLCCCCFVLFDLIFRLFYKPRSSSV